MGVVTSRPRPTLLTVVPLEGRGDLPFHTVHGTPLVLHAATALAGLGPVVVTGEKHQRRWGRTLLPGWVDFAEAEEIWDAHPGRVLLHDSLCPLVPRAFLEEVAGSAGSAAAYRPVTDTLKVVQDDRTVGTVDREKFGIVTSPLLLVGVSQQPPTEDFAATVLWLRQRTSVTLVKAPSIGRRAADLGSLSVLESVDALARSVREYQ
jgi:2-C-methyl-D-erythritol 4-phosphate cytidylyltransferase